MFHEAVATLRRAVACSTEPSFSILAALGEAHLSCHEIGAARAAWEKARVLAQGQEVELADAALVNVKLLQGEQDNHLTDVATAQV